MVPSATKPIWIMSVVLETTLGAITVDLYLEARPKVCLNFLKLCRNVRLTHTVVLADPFEDPPGLVVPAVSPEPGPEVWGSDRLAADEDLSDEEELSPRARAEKTAQREAQAQATILEMIGDLPEADCAPPENVLFVCKLNPVTTDEDLETLFSRFGRVVSCEVIRDRKTQDSLQYAFVEFENPQACEQAYFKMDNVLIDDRRIHVDFSQSVSKYQWKGKGRLTIRGQERPPPPAARREPRPRRSPSPRSRSRKSSARPRSRSRDQRRPRSSSRSRDKKKRSRSRSRDKKKRARSRSRERERSNRHRRPKSRSRSRDRRRSQDKRRR
eukprot:TCALIF_07598-PA protein Name:"Similar to cyp6 Peptidyl-prolyl cis-trans isomerase-like 4 (Aspergillus oryzae (strain ATCC 42149 / RIB 40))" AED:0.16 eAED:0.16 QI:0/0/0/0.66/1/1/3/0/326